MKTFIALCAILFCVNAWADDAEYAASSKRAAGMLLRASLNDPDSLIVESATLYRRIGPFANVCGTLRTKNAYGGYIRANFVVSDNAQMPVYIGPIPLAAFKKDCSGEAVQ